MLVVMSITATDRQIRGVIEYLERQKLEAMCDAMANKLAKEIDVARAGIEKRLSALR